MIKATSVVIASATACAPSRGRAQAIGGVVRDQAGHLLRGVGVMIPSDSGKPLAHGATASDGTFTLAVPAAGVYRVELVIAVDVAFTSDTIRVAGDAFVQREFQLTVPPDAAFYEFQVDKPAVPAPGSRGPRYPEPLRSRKVNGGVYAQFIVDTTGTVRPGSFTALRQTHAEFVTAVAQALTGMKFLPAEREGRKVAQLVQQPFFFQMTNKPVEIP